MGRKGSEPKVKPYLGRRNASYSGFVRSDTGELRVESPDRFDYETTIDCIRGFLSSCPDDRKYCIVMDNAPWHKKALRLIRENDGGMYNDILSLPPYSPDLNPIEQVWRFTRKKKTHNRFFKDLETLKGVLGEFFESLSRPNAYLKSLCNFRWIKGETQAE